MKHNFKISSITSSTFMVLATILLSGCAASMAPKPTLINIAQPKIEVSIGEVWIGPFLDERPDGDMGQSYFGTIRGGYGNPIERLKLEKPASEAMSEIVVNIFHSAGYRTNPVPTSMRVNYSGGWFIENVGSPLFNAPLVVGRIKSFYARNNPWAFPSGSRHIEFKLEICVLDPKIKSTILCDTISGDDGDTGIAGLSGNSEVMGPWLIRLAEDKIKAWVAKTSIAQIWKEHISKQMPDKQDTNPNQIEDRLSELRRLFGKELITEEEYNQKKSEIIKGL